MIGSETIREILICLGAESSATALRSLGAKLKEQLRAANPELAEEAFRVYDEAFGAEVDRLRAHILDAQSEAVARALSESDARLVQAIWESNDGRAFLEVWRRALPIARQAAQHAANVEGLAAHRRCAEKAFESVVDRRAAGGM